MIPRRCAEKDSAGQGLRSHLGRGTPVMQAEMHGLRPEMVDRRWLFLITPMVPA